MVNSSPSSVKMAVKLFPQATSTGLESTSSPSLYKLNSLGSRWFFIPHMKRRPSSVMAAAWNCPAAILTTLTSSKVSMVIGSGSMAYTSRLSVPPCPSCPWSFLPQRYTLPSSVRAMAKECPETRSTTFSCSMYSSGSSTRQSVLLPSPVRPYSPTPQLMISPSSVSTEVWSSPTTALLTATCSSTRLSTTLGRSCSAESPCPSMPAPLIQEPPNPQVYSRPSWSTAAECDSPAVAETIFTSSSPWTLTGAAATSETLGTPRRPYFCLPQV
mmetsp:Transcript_4839/g.14426  ORF Transcript_4839/g.14426 Transcript_4839/m.14426 type:complete len:271 (+) Transcript_4839:323-1135(+)